MPGKARIFSSVPFVVSVVFVIPSRVGWVYSPTI
jgi:hypothetical protein